MPIKKRIICYSIFIILILSLSSYSTTAVNTWYFEIDDQFTFKKTENISINSNTNNTLRQFITYMQKNSSFIPMVLLEEVSGLEKYDYFDYNLSLIPQDNYSPIEGDLLINDSLISENVSSLIIIPSSLLDNGYDSTDPISIYFNNFFAKFNWTHNLEVYSKEYNYNSGDIWVIETILNFQSFEEDGFLWQGYFKWEYAYSGEAYWLSAKIWQITPSSVATFANSDPEYDDTKMTAFYHFSFTSQTVQDLTRIFKNIQKVVWIIVFSLFMGIPVIIIIYQTIKK